MASLKGNQIAAARALLGWDQKDVAERVGLTVAAISKIENGENRGKAETLNKIERVFDHAGIEFLSGDGVKKKEQTVRIYTGHEGQIEFQWDVYNTVKEMGGEICVSNVDEKDSLKWLGEEEAKKYKDAMASLDIDFFFKILIQEGDDYFAASAYAEYRFVPKEEFGRASFYVYGDKLAILSYDDNAIINVIENKMAADAYRSQFNVMWERAGIIDLGGKA